jgi:putative MFS transporter
VSYEESYVTGVKHTSLTSSLFGFVPPIHYSLRTVESLGMGPFQRRILIAAGLCFASDSMEILLLSFLAVVLQVEWDLTESQTATITSSVFAGAMIGTLVLGPLADHIGRKPVFTITAAMICVSSFATAAANSFPVLLLCRFCVGLGIGGLTVPFDTLAEFVPTSHRGTNLLTIQYFWTGGTLLVPVLAYFSLSEGDGSHGNGWRIFVLLCGLPCLASTILGLLYVPESPRWLMTKGKHGKALKILRLAAKRNGKDPMELFPENTQLVDDEEVDENSSFCNLLAPHWRRITLLLWGTWAGMQHNFVG